MGGNWKHMVGWLQSLEACTFEFNKLPATQMPSSHLSFSVQKTGCKKVVKLSWHESNNSQNLGQHNFSHTNIHDQEWHSMPGFGNGCIYTTCLSSLGRQVKLKENLDISGQIWSHHSLIRHRNHRKKLLGTNLTSFKPTGLLATATPVHKHPKESIDHILAPVTLWAASMSKTLIRKTWSAMGAGCNQKTTRWLLFFICPEIPRERKNTMSTDLYSRQSLLFSRHRLVSCWQMFWK